MHQREILEKRSFFHFQQYSERLFLESHIKLIYVILICFFLLASSACTSGTGGNVDPMTNRGGDSGDNENETLTSITIVRGDGTEYEKTFTAQEIEEWLVVAEQELNNISQDAESISSRSRFNQLQDIASVCHIAISSYYQLHRSMPTSVTDLQTANLFWLEPIPQEYTEGLTIIEEQLGPPNQDLNSIQLTFDLVGYYLIYYDPYNQIYPVIETDKDEYTRVDLSKPGFAYDYGSFLDEFPSQAVVDSNPLSVRINYLSSICEELMAEYWALNQAVPETTEDLLNGRWEVSSGVLDDIETIAEGDDGYFYFGVSVENHIAYIEYMYPESAPTISQKIYLVDDPSAPPAMDEMKEIGRYVCGDEAVLKSETICLISSDSNNWGFPYP